MLLLRCKADYRDLRLKNVLKRNELLAYNTPEKHTIPTQQHRPDCTALHTSSGNGDSHKGLGINGHSRLIAPTMPEIGEEKEAEAEIEKETKKPIETSQQLVEP